MSAPESASEPCFPPGTPVRLRCCPHGMPGTVAGAKRGRILVDWPDLGFLGSHPPASLAVCAPGGRP